MQILSSTVDLLRWALQRWERNSHVTLCQACHYGKDRILEYEVNWSACGSRSVKDTARFIDSLKTASNLATEINHFRFEVVDIDRLPGPELPDAIREKKGTQDRIIVETLVERLSMGRWASITRWLDEQRIS